MTHTIQDHNTDNRKTEKEKREKEKEKEREKQQESEAASPKAASGKKSKRGERLRVQNNDSSTKDTTIRLQKVDQLSDEFDRKIKKKGDKRRPAQSSSPSTLQSY